VKAGRASIARHPKSHSDARTDVGAPHLFHGDVHVAIETREHPSVVDSRVEFHDNRTTRHLRRGAPGGRQGRKTVRGAWHPV